jgi:hypothetical protein
VDPRVVDLYHAGVTAAPALAGAVHRQAGGDRAAAGIAAAGITASAAEAAVRDEAERAVLALLRQD